MNHELTPEDSALLAALAALEPASAAGGPAAQAVLASAASPDPARPANAPDLEDGGAAALETLRTLTRLYHETLGLVPFGLPPMAPRPQVKHRLMSAIAIAGAAAPVEPRLAAQASPGTVPDPGKPPVALPEAAAPPPPVAPLPFPRPAAVAPAAASPSLAAPLVEGPSAAPPSTAAPSVVAASAAPSAVAPSATVPSAVAPFAASPSAAFAAPPAARRRAPRAYRIGLGLAAALVVALLATCAWFYRGLLDQAATIARLGDERDAAQRRAEDLAARLAHQAVEMTGMRQSFSVVTSPAVEVCALRPVAPDAGDAHGILFVAADHQHWYMSLRGLHPTEQGKIYQLWFVGPQGPISGGTFNARSGQPWELGAEHMPQGTREITITLETGTGSLTPNGPAMFRNSDLFRVS